ncbi:MAG: ABC transporter substrate-binding protein [Candidatus Rokuibacteriota bacterium]
MSKRRVGWVLGLAILGIGFGWAGPVDAQGVLRVGIASSLNTLDPPKMKIGEEYVFNYLAFNALTQIGPDLKVRPDLAERWEASPDLKTWTFHLRKGVKFHHGRELDAEDVVASVKRIMDKATGSAARVNLAVIKDATAVDKYTVRFTLHIPYSGLAEVMGDRVAKITPRDRVDSLATAPVGTGPFKFKEYVPGDHLTVVKNPDYFERGVPVLDEVVLRIIPESAALTTALEAGSIDLILFAPLEALEKMKANPALVVDSVPSSSWDAVVMRCDIPPFNNVKLRQALAAVADKSALTQLALFGHGTPTHTAIAPSHPFFHKGLPIRKPDAALGKKLMAEAGFPNGMDLKLFIPAGRPARERVGIATRELAKAIGMRIDLQRVPWDKFVADIEGKAEFNVDGFFSRPTIDTAIYPWYHSTGSWNALTWHYSNPKVDQLLDQARATASEEEQRRLYQEFQAIVDQEVPGIVPYVVNHVNAYRKQVQGFKSTPMMWLDLRRVTLAK